MNERRIIQRERIVSYEQPRVEMLSREEIHPLTAFFHTKVYDGFVSFCEECCRSRFMGVCYGASGVGKTLAARTYARWDIVEPLLLHYGMQMPPLGTKRLSFQTALYTLERTRRPKQIENDIGLLQWSMQDLAKRSYHLHQEAGLLADAFLPDAWQLLILDNAHYLDAYTVDVIQNLYDRHRIGVIFLGPPSLVEHSALSRHAHVPTRIGRYYPFRLLSQEEMHPLVAQFVSASGLEYGSKQGCSLDWFVTKVYEMTFGNVSLLRLFLLQVETLLRGKTPPVITEAIVEHAYRQLRLS